MNRARRLQQARFMDLKKSLEVVSQPRLTPDGGVANLSKCSHTGVYAALSNRPAPIPQG